MSQTGSKGFGLVMATVNGFCSVRGASTIMRFFPHAVADLPRVLEALEQHMEWHTAFWQIKYLLLLWYDPVVSGIV